MKAIPYAAAFGVPFSAVLSSPTPGGQGHHPPPKHNKNPERSH